MDTKNTLDGQLRLIATQTGIIRSTRLWTSRSRMQVPSADRKSQCQNRVALRRSPSKHCASIQPNAGPPRATAIDDRSWSLAPDPPFIAIVRKRRRWDTMPFRTLHEACGKEGPVAISYVADRSFRGSASTRTGVLPSVKSEPAADTKLPRPAGVAADDRDGCCWLE